MIELFTNGLFYVLVTFVIYLVFFDGNDTL
jgi:hypothetical protein